MSCLSIIGKENEEMLFFRSFSDDRSSDVLVQKQNLNTILSVPSKLLHTLYYML